VELQCSIGKLGVSWKSLTRVLKNKELAPHIIKGSRHFGPNRRYNQAHLIRYHYTELRHRWSEAAEARTKANLS
jgi:hypothetical protein